jgi:hypothetical protein
VKVFTNLPAGLLKVLIYASDTNQAYLQYPGGTEYVDISGNGTSQVTYTITHFEKTLFEAKGNNVRIKWTHYGISSGDLSLCKVQVETKDGVIKTISPVPSSATTEVVDVPIDSLVANDTIVVKAYASSSGLRWRRYNFYLMYDLKPAISDFTILGQSIA